MQYIFTAKVSLEEFIDLGKSYPFPPAPVKRCHNPACNRIVQFKKHGFYNRYFISRVYRTKIYVRRYICPICGCTISYLPHFCLPGFIHALEHIFEYIYGMYWRHGTIMAALERLNNKNPGLDLSRQLVFHYRNRFLKNLPLIENGLRQVYGNIRLPEETLEKEERAKKLLEIVKNGPSTIHSFSQQFHQETNKTFLALCK